MTTAGAATPDVTRARARSFRWGGGLLTVALLVGVTACSSDAGSDQSAKPTTTVPRAKVTSTTSTTSTPPPDGATTTTEGGAQKPAGPCELLPSALLEKETGLTMSEPRLDPRGTDGTGGVCERTATKLDTMFLVGVSDSSSSDAGLARDMIKALDTTSEVRKIDVPAPASAQAAVQDLLGKPGVVSVALVVDTGESTVVITGPMSGSTKEAFGHLTTLAAAAVDGLG